ncbi:MAG: putative nucleotidyltransferase [Microbacterium sp.]|jgi:predicted nucleotidyltransferase|nr:putative nucleotidyltransferase [Microbacterium sp.]
MNIRAGREAAGMSQAELARAARVAQPNISAYENGRRQPSPEVLKRIRRALVGTLNERLFRHRDEIHRLVAEHHATAPRVFGSVARGEETAASDIDILVDFTPEAGLLDEVGLRLALADLLHVEVDVIASDTLRGEFRERVLREAVPL